MTSTETIEQLAARLAGIPPQQIDVAINRGSIAKLLDDIEKLNRTNAAAHAELIACQKANGELALLLDREKLEAVMSLLDAAITTVRLFKLPDGHLLSQAIAKADAIIKTVPLGIEESRRAENGRQRSELGEQAARHVREMDTAIADYQYRLNRAIELVECALTDDSLVGETHRHLTLILAVLEGREVHPGVAAQGNCISGTCVAAGDDEAGDCRLIINTTREQLAAFQGNLVFAEVEVRLTKGATCEN